MSRAWLRWLEPRRFWSALTRPLPTPQPQPKPALLSRAWRELHLASTLVLVVVTTIAFWAHWKGFMGWPPRGNGDEGIYTSQAWAVQTLHALSPFAYFYDHPPAGWILMSGFTWLTSAFERSPTTLIATREFMVWVHLASSLFLFGLARRIGMKPTFAGLAVLLFSLSPLGLHYQRMAFLDNIVVLWLVAGLFFLASPRRSVASGVAAGICFSLAVLTKETVAPVVLAAVVFFWYYTDPRNRLVRAVCHYGFYLIIASYLWYALNKNELLPGPGHVSLWGTFLWQIEERQPTGSLFDSHSQTFAMVANWAHTDPVVLLGGLFLMPLAFLDKRLRGIVVMALAHIALTFRNGYLPYAYVTLIFPLFALIIAGALNWCWEGWTERYAARSPRRLPAWVPRAATVCLRTGMLAGAVLAVYIITPIWQPTLHRATTAEPDLAVHQATAYVQTHIPNGAMVVTDNNSWTDIARLGLNPAPIDKLELDPAVRRKLIGGWRDIDYILSTKLTTSDEKTYPITAQAVRNSEVMHSFGSGESTLYLRRVVKPQTY
jgi:hypothetical protein